MLVPRLSPCGETIFSRSAASSTINYIERSSTRIKTHQAVRAQLYLSLLAVISLAI